MLPSLEGFGDGGLIEFIENLYYSLFLYSLQTLS
jgi:hypothetical protein